MYSRSFHFINFSSLIPCFYLKLLWWYLNDCKREYTPFMITVCLYFISVPRNDEMRTTHSTFSKGKMVVITCLASAVAVFFSFPFLNHEPTVGIRRVRDRLQYKSSTRKAHASSLSSRYLNRIWLLSFSSASNCYWSIRWDVHKKSPVPLIYLFCLMRIFLNNTSVQNKGNHHQKATENWQIWGLLSE